MKKFYVNSLGDILTGEEHILRRHHRDTPLFDDAESALKIRLELANEKIEVLRNHAEMLQRRLDDPAVRVTILIDEDNRWTQI